MLELIFVVIALVWINQMHKSIKEIKFKLDILYDININEDILYSRMSGELIGEIKDLLKQGKRVEAIKLLETRENIDFLVGQLYISDIEKFYKI